ncbi:MAG: 50S ribosomal protein L9 [Clostridia bacterium]|nr:50S ribosomal protein L9 [Clostridia bacterium]
MKVILLCDVKDIGKKDDIVNVSDGYARNFLYPRKWAMEATPQAIAVVERKREAARKLEAERRAAAEKIASKLAGKVVELKAKCGDKGRLYGSITSAEVAEAMNARYEVEIDKKKIDIKSAVRALGDYEMIVHVYPNITAKMTLRVKNIQEA